MRASIVMSTFNKAAALDRTLASIRRQQVPFEYEVIVVDDGSADNTPLVCERYGVVYRFLNRTAYLNPGFPRNIGYRMAQGEIVIAQSDEIEHITPNAIELLVTRLKPETVLVAQVYNVRNGKVLEDYSGPRCQRPLLFLGSLWRRDIYAIGGNDEEFVEPGFEDVWFASCLTEGLGRRFEYTDEVIGYHHDHPRPANTVHPESGRICNEKHARAKADPSLWVASGGPWPFKP